MSRVVAFNSYDYPSGLERGNWLAWLIGTLIRLPGSGPVFARMETMLFLKGILRGGFVDASKLDNDFLVELRRSGSRKGYPRVNCAIMRNLNGRSPAAARLPKLEETRCPAWSRVPC